MGLYARERTFLMIKRFGSFFLLIGSGLLVLFVLSDLAGSAQISLLIYGLLLSVLGIVLRIRGKQAREPQESRFRTLRRLRAGQSSEDRSRAPVSER